MISSRSTSPLPERSATKSPVAKTTAASVASSNASNTIVITPTVTTLGSGTTVFTGSFTGFSRFFLVDAGVTLPLVLTDFSARVNSQKNAVLNWTTSSEQNNRQFDVEMSMNGVNFVSLGAVPSKGNSLTPQNYEYLHIKPQPGITWYRLKQTDWDDKSTYSKIVFITIDKGLVKSFIYPVPAKERVTVNFGSVIAAGRIEIFSADMKILKRENINGPSIKKEVNINDLPQGVYFIRLANGSSSEILRFVKE